MIFSAIMSYLLLLLWSVEYYVVVPSCHYLLLCHWLLPCTALHGHWLRPCEGVVTTCQEIDVAMVTNFWNVPLPWLLSCGAALSLATGL